MNRPSLNEFVEPPWHEPVDTARALAATPENATITGMFLEPTAREARKKGKPLPSAREKYVPFSKYPLREHVQLLIEASAAFFPGRPLRIALRKLGRAAPAALLNSHYGRVGVGSAQSVRDIVVAMAKSYPVSMPCCTSEVVDMDARSVVVRFKHVPYFLDCHHVGVFEGVMRYANVDGEVKVRMHSHTDGDLLCSWK